MLAKELDLIESKSARESVVDRIDVLDKVGDLLLLPNAEYATTEQVAMYYEVSVDTVGRLATRNDSELKSDGYKSFRKSNVIELLNGHGVQLEGQLPATLKGSGL